jgi:ATP-binding cassette, subfamily F, member 3
VSLLTLTDAAFDFGREPILEGVNLALHAGTRYALVGANGSGKTTLLEILAGERSLHGGRHNMTGGVALGYLRQSSHIAVHHDQTTTVREAVRTTAFARERALQGRLNEIAAGLSRTEGDADQQAALIARQGALQSEFERLDGYSLEARIEAALHGVGVPPAVWDGPVERLSGGERRRAALAATLLKRCDLLLLDEPTNHLDLESCEWLEGHLLSRSCAMVIVSHDRWFLDRVAQRTLSLDRGRLTDDSGNYSVHLQVVAERRRQEQAAWQRQNDHIRQTEAYIRKNIAGQKTRQAQSRRKQLSRLARIDRPLSQERGFRLDLSPLRPSGATVLQVEGLAKGYGARRLFTDFDLLVVRGERVGILGPNGCGKTTLLRLLAGKESADEGRVVRGHNVDLGYYDQHLKSVSDHLTVLGEMQAVDPSAPLVEQRTFLGAFGFGEEMVDRPVASLSGGERGRLALLRLIKQGFNTLLLDEPTNHLDIRSRESLERALRDYPGTLVMVSHDRRFLDRLVDRLLVFPEAGPEDRLRGIRMYMGNYADYERQRAEERARRAEGIDGSDMRQGGSVSTGPVPHEQKRQIRGLSKNERARRQAWIREIEQRIAELEQEQVAGIEQMSCPGCDPERRMALAERSAAIEEELSRALAKWEGWSAELEEGED